MNLSVIMPYLNDQETLALTLPRILSGMPLGESELIIVNDGSYEKLEVKDPRVTVINLKKNSGVGLAFNQGVEIAKSCNIVLMGCDVIPQDGWYERVLEDLDGSFGTIYNCVSSGFSEEREPFSGLSTRRYGAFLLFTVSKHDLPTNSGLQDDPKFSKILQAKWNYEEPDKGEVFTEIGCLLGAFYWMKKKEYQRINGWNGHRKWGSLEPMLSIKARAHGMRLVVDKKLEAAHYYGRGIQRPTRMDLQFYNQLFMAHTMFSDALREELIDHLRYGGRREKIEKLNVNQARVMIKRDHGLVQRERDYNNHHFKHGLIKNWDNFLNN